jgi:hypothetical protein
MLEAEAGQIAVSIQIKIKKIKGKIIYKIKIKLLLLIIISTTIKKIGSTLLNQLHQKKMYILI